MRERLNTPRSTESGSKQRLRTIKRASGSKEGVGTAPQGQRKAIRGNRTRQRHT